MKNNTITKAIELGFNFDQFDNDQDWHEVTKEVLDFLNENADKLGKQYEECEVTSHGNSQNVSWGDYTSSGDIISWREYWHEPRQKIEHSDFLYITEDGTPIQMVLWCWSKDE